MRETTVTDLHPLVAQLHPSAEQVPAIRSRGADVVVTAGAGTGKTRTLVARMLSLLAEGLPLRSIVAVTFTRKAAREMRNRVREEMRRYLQRGNLTSEERETWYARYRALDAARIGTIHRLCAEILHAHPAEAAVDPRFEMLDEGQAALLRRRAVAEALAWAADTPEIVPLFKLLGEQDLRRTLEDLLERRLDVEESLAALPEAPAPFWEERVAARQREGLEALRRDPAWQEAVATLRRTVPSCEDDLLALQRRQALDSLLAAVGSVEDQLAALAGLDAISLRGGRAKAWPGGSAGRDAVKDALRTLRDVWRAATLEAWKPNDLDRLLDAAIAPLQALLEVANRRYTDLKQERNGLDFDDLEERALSLLRQRDAVRAHWQQEIRAILVDEFQDTNERQRDLLALLKRDQGVLFVVGDAKQSIYRFRGADVTVFRQERQQVESAGGVPLQLRTSYRAHEGLIDGLNDLLCLVLEAEEDPQRPWVEPFAPLRPHRRRAGPGFAPPHIEIHLTVGRKSHGALDRAATALAWRLVQLVEREGLEVPEGRGTRPLDYGDIAILCRASRSFAAYEDALERAGVPFLTVAGRGFYDRPEIRDLLNALRAVADPVDDLALAGLLRSPALGLSDTALYLLTRARDQRLPDASLWEALQVEGPGLPGSDGPRAEWAVALIGDLHGRVGRMPVADLLKHFLDRTDYCAAMIEAQQRRAGRNVNKLLAEARDRGIVGVGEFLEVMAATRQSGAREGEARTTAEGVAQIMSIHAAKGLEFPVVVIGDVTREGWQPYEALADPDLGLLLPLSQDKERAAIYRLAKERADDQEAAESDRLFYVAATRARERLLLNGCVAQRKDGTLTALGEWLDRLAEPIGLTALPADYDQEGEGVVRLQLEVGSTPLLAAIYEPGFDWDRPGAGPLWPQERAAMPPPLLQPVQPDRLEVDPDTEERESDPPRRVWRVVPVGDRPRAPAWVVGSLVHEALEAWRFPDADFDLWAEARARGYGITDPAQLADAVRAGRTMLCLFRDHPLFQEVQQADQRLHEVPYSRLAEGTVQGGAIDLLYRAGERWTVVEFKTDAVKDETDLLRLFAEKDYLEQAQRYLEAVEVLLGQRPRFLFCMLNYAGAVLVRSYSALVGRS